MESGISEPERISSVLMIKKVFFSLLEDDKLFHLLGALVSTKVVDPYILFIV